MRLMTHSFVDHRTGGRQDVPFGTAADAMLMVPGACTTCYGSCCSSCCGTPAPTAGRL